MKEVFKLVWADQTGDAISLRMGAFILSSKEEIRQILFFKSSKDDTRLKTITVEGTLNSGNYAEIRDAVRHKLGQQSLDFVTELDLSPNPTA